MFIEAFLRAAIPFSSNYGYADIFFSDVRTPPEEKSLLQEKLKVFPFENGLDAPASSRAPATPPPFLWTSHLFS